MSYYSCVIPSSLLIPTSHIWSTSTASRSYLGATIGIMRFRPAYPTGISCRVCTVYGLVTSSFSIDANSIKWSSPVQVPMLLAISALLGLRRLWSYKIEPDSWRFEKYLDLLRVRLKFSWDSLNTSMGTHVIAFSAKCTFPKGGKIRRSFIIVSS